MKLHLFRLTLALACCLLGGVPELRADNKPNTIVVEAGSAESLLHALAEANGHSPSLIYVPAGVYDLGERTLNLVAGNGTAIIGEGMDRTIIMNRPKVENEGISRTATLLITAEGCYLQDLTVRNAMDYYSAGAAGRAVCIQDLGSKTIANRVRLDSRQDTYYPKNGMGDYYWRDSEIHGTVDFICGRGDVYFDRCRIVVEKRNPDGTGGCVIAAPNTSKTFGMLFYGCTIENRTETYSLARSWGAPARCIYVNTTLLDPERLTPTRFTPQGMNCMPDRFLECNSTDSLGHELTPEYNMVEFFKDRDRKLVNTSVAPEEAKRYTVDMAFTEWKPLRELAQWEEKASKYKPEGWHFLK